MEPKQIKLDIIADRGHVADALRELATYIEEWDCDESTEYPSQYESDICAAEITEE